MARMIRQERIGFVTANNDVAAARQALLTAKSDPELLQDMGRRAFRYLRENFTLNKAAQAYVDLILNYSPTGDAQSSDRTVAPVAWRVSPR